MCCEEHPSHGGFPTTRMRRLRYHPAVRRLVRDTRLSAANLILPLFVRPGENLRREISAMPGNAQLSPDLLAAEVRQAAELGLGGVILFGIPGEKDGVGSDATSDLGIIPQAIRAAKRAAPELLVITDVCFCEYTDHGQCGVLSEATGRMDVDNDATLRLLADQAVVHARAGADMVAPSGMMDGMVGAIRGALDAAGFSHVPILSYAAKYASAFYGPFREAAESAPRVGDRRGYQMDPAAAAGQALREIELDLAEGADLIMVKPALPYLDIIHQVHRRWPGVPLAAYNVSGEFSMVKAAAANGWLDEKAVALECLTAIHRAGAGIILTYWAKDVARWLEEH
ncbi:MAG: delta-aminolevulinic acid dehydratase [Planctomycetes bacterium RBG_13_63_9]|nr:MAG: delta-aminolevulinic acid dehydratase [Planctomycetes bacterium RBG_13_63_9]